MKKVTFFHLILHASVLYYKKTRKGGTCYGYFSSTDTKVRLKGKGVPSLRNPQVRGDHYVTLVIQTPEKLSPEAKEVLRHFDQS